MESKEAKRESEEAAELGLSAQGMLNLKSVHAAARLAEYETQLKSKQDPIISGVALPETPTPPGPEGGLFLLCVMWLTMY